MRQFIAPLALGMFLAVAGCNSIGFISGNRSPTTPAGPEVVPTAARLVEYLNDNARRVQSVQCNDMEMDCSQNAQSVNVQARMVCQKPRNFRLRAELVGQSAVDLGSNQNEFWYWISKADPPYLYHCSYDEFQRGVVRMPFPFQPEWILEAMGIVECDPTKQYTVRNAGKLMYLEETTTSPQGIPVRKITVFNRESNGSRTQVASRVLVDAKTNKEICRADIQSVHYDPTSGAVLPRVIVLNWPAEKIRLQLKFHELRVNGQMGQEQVVALFSRPQLTNVPSYDLARRSIDGNQTGLQRVRGQLP